MAQPTRKPGATAGGSAAGEHSLECVDVKAVFVERDAGDVDRMVADDTESEIVGRRLDEHHVAGLREDRQHLLESL